MFKGLCTLSCPAIVHNVAPGSARTGEPRGKANMPDCTRNPFRCRAPHQIPKFSCFWPSQQTRRSGNTRTCAFQPIPDPPHGESARVWQKQSKMLQEATEEVMTLPGERVRPGCCWLQLSSQHLPLPGLTTSTHVFQIPLKVLTTEPVF